MSSKKSSPVWLDVLITALGPMIWGSTYIVTTELLPPDVPFTAALIRTLPPGILLILYSRHLPQPGQWLQVLILAILNIGIFQSLLFIAAYRLPGGLAAIVGAIQPLLVIGLAWMVDGRRPVQMAVWGSILGIAGMGGLLLSPNAQWDLVGAIAAFVGTSSMAVGTYLTQRWRPNLPIIAFTGWQLALGGLILIPTTLLLDPPLPDLTWINIAGFAYLSFFGAILAYGLWFRGVARLSPVAASSLGLLSPVMAVVMGWIILDQRLTGLSLVGMITVLGSILAVQWAMSKNRR